MNTAKLSVAFAVALTVLGLTFSMAFGQLPLPCAWNPPTSINDPMCDWEACVDTGGGSLDCSTYTLKYYRSADLLTPDVNITRAIIAIHGRRDNRETFDDRPYNYYESIHDAAVARSLLNQTLIIAPYFCPAYNCQVDTNNSCDDTLPKVYNPRCPHVAHPNPNANPDGRLCWSSSTDEGDYPGGGNADNDDHVRTSSFGLVDNMIDTLAHLKTTGVFPNLDTIVVVGHSAGGQTTLRYAIAGSAEPEGITVRYVPVNAGAVTYLNGLRPTQEAKEAFPNMGYEWDCDDDRTREEYSPPGEQGRLEDTEDWRNYPASFSFPSDLIDCVSDDSYDNWPWGIANVDSANDYLATHVVSPAALRSQYLKRNVAIIAGIDDNLYRSSETCGGPEPVSEWNCAHALQGHTRTERSALFFQYECLGFGCPNHAFETVCIDGNGACDFFDLCPDVDLDDICDNFCEDSDSDGNCDSINSFITIPCDDGNDANHICEKRVMHGPIFGGGDIYDSDVTREAIFNGLIPVPTETQWGKTLGGVGSEKAVAVEQTPEGGYIVLGETNSYGAGGKDLWVVKFDETGNVLWQKTYGGEGDDTAAAMTALPEGGYLLVGSTNSYANGERDAWVVKIEEDGTLVWSHSYGGDLIDEAVAVSTSSDGNYVVGARMGITEPSSGAWDIWLMKLDPNGEKLWRKTFEGSVWDGLSSLQRTWDGGYILAGNTQVRNGDFWVLKVDPDGNLQRERVYGMNELGYPEGNENVELAPQLKLTHDGGYIMAGASYPIIGGPGMIWVLKLTDDLTITWQKLLNAGGHCDISSIQSTTDGGFVVSVLQKDPGLFLPYDRLVMKLDSSGNPLWQQGYGTSGDDKIYAVMQTRDDGYIGVGVTETLSFGEQDLWVIKLDKNGQIPDCPSIQPFTIGTQAGPSEGPGDYSSSVEESEPPAISWTSLVTVTDPPSGQVLAGDGCTNIWNLINLPRTGQTIPYRMGDDGHIQAGVAWPTVRFVDNGDGTITDYLTGLVWLKDANCALSAGHDPDGRMAWEPALNFVAGINSGTVDISGCGYLGEADDWRLANINEMESLLHAGVPNQADSLNGHGFEHVRDDYPYWTSTPIAGPVYQHSVLTISMQQGRTTSGGDTQAFFAWPVRGGQQGYPDPNYPANVWRTGRTAVRYPGDDGDVHAGVAWPSNRFIDHEDGTVTDTLTGLMWLQDGSCLGYLEWWAAIERVADFNTTPESYPCSNYTAGYDDWRLPNRKELRSLIDHQRYLPALPEDHKFMGVQTSNYYWTSSTRLWGANNSSSVWTVNMAVGNTQSLAKWSWYGNTWAVRGEIHGEAVRNADFDGDGDVDGRDLATLTDAFGFLRGDDNFNPKTDLIVDETINQADLQAFVPHLGRTNCPCE